jgi:chromatin modification-related protein YNG2
MQKIQGEWAKVEQYQLDKIKLATRLEAIISRARERGQAEWRKVGGMDLDEIEKQDGRTLFGELGGSEVLLPSSGLGSGSDGRPLKSEFGNSHDNCGPC